MSTIFVFNSFQSWLIPSIQLTLIFALITISFLKNLKHIRIIALLVTLIVFVLCSMLWVLFNNTTPHWQFVAVFPWNNLWNTHFIYGVDGISLFFIVLTGFLMPLTVLSVWGVNKNLKALIICLLMIEFFLINVFATLDLLLFFIFFEAVLPPMMFLIGVWGSRRRKIKANYYFILYTLFGSIFMLLGVILVFLETGTTSMVFLFKNDFNFSKQCFLWFCFFVGFAVKIPIVPLHIWLPEAHVEAPTVGSVILASLLLKLGGYGFIRISLSMFPQGLFYFLPLVNTVAAISILYASFIALIQIDMKRIIAYSSIAHMNLVVLGIFSLTVQGLQGSIVLMIGHGFVSAGLFFIIGMVYDRHHTKLIKYYGGLARIMPLFNFFLIFFSFANISLPGTSNFIGELLIFVGVFDKNPFLVIVGFLGAVLATAYSIWLYSRVMFGELRTTFLHYFVDANKREVAILFPLVLGTILLGLYPAPILDSTYASSKLIIEVLNNS